MVFKGVLRNASFLVQMICLISVVLLGSFFVHFSFFTFGFIQSGFSVSTATEAMNHLFEDGNTIRGLLFFDRIGYFILPALLLAYLFSTDKSEYLRVDTSSSFAKAGLTILSLIVAIPFINYLGVLNHEIPFPAFMDKIVDWMKDIEANNDEVVKLLLITDHFPTLLLNIIIIGFLTAIGEEFLFRGVLHRMFEKLFRKKHWVIWIVAVLFSAVHLEFYNFLPRLLLGAYFGYLLYYTGSIWIPVLAHLTNNTIGVLSYYQSAPGEISPIDTIGTVWWHALISLLLWAVLFYFFFCRNSQDK